MEIVSLPEYPCLALDGQQTCCCFVPSGSNIREYHRCTRCIGPFHDVSEGEADVVSVPTDHTDRLTLEDARLILGPQITFTIGSEEEKISAHKIVDTLSRASVKPHNQSATAAVTCHESEECTQTLRFCLGRKSKGTFEKGANSIAFRNKEEFFMRPILTRSLSLP